MLDSKPLLLIINAFLFTKLFYYPTVWGNTSKSNKKKYYNWSRTLQEKIVLGLRKFDHISQGLKSLRWLCIEDKLLLNTAVMVHKCQNHQVPDYFNDKFLYRSQVHNRQLRSVVNNDLNLHIVGFLVAEVICFPRSKTLNCSRSFENYYLIKGF